MMIFLVFRNFRTALYAAYVCGYAGVLAFDKMLLLVESWLFIVSYGR